MTMQAAVYATTGSDDVLGVQAVPVPEPGTGEVRVKVAACGVNPVDRIGMRGTYPVNPMPHIPGCEAVGTVDAVGPGVSEARLGERVVVAFKLFDGQCRACLTGHEETCEHGGIFGIKTNGGYAQYCVAPVQNLVRLPDGLSFLDAASLALAGATAWHMMLTRAQVQAGEHVVVFGATGGVGSTAVQIARLAGAHVVAVVSPGKRGAVDKLGAEHVFELGPDLVSNVRKVTGGGADVVCNPIGTAVWGESVEVLALNGRWTTCGVLTGDRAELAIRP
ncbi:MAG: alcohol dehydrogenase catalytic domain-containing protein, partial [Candidatus Xenobia bacterium]